jgi:hypothetical protein
VLAGIWGLVAMIGEGLFVRLVRARSSIIRSITTINLIRAALIELLPISGPRLVLEQAYASDSDPPKMLLVTSSASAAGLAGCAASFITPWLATSGLRVSPPWTAYLLGALVLVINLSWYLRAAQRMARPLMASGNDPVAPADRT